MGHCVPLVVEDVLETGKWWLPQQAMNANPPTQNKQNKNKLQYD